MKIGSGHTVEGLSHLDLVVAIARLACSCCWMRNGSFADECKLDEMLAKLREICFIVAVQCARRLAQSEICLMVAISDLHK